MWFKPGYRSSLGTAFFMFAALSTVQAESSQLENSECSIRDSSEKVVLVVCPAGLDQPEWRAAGTKACRSTTGICNAWIWDSQEKAPEKAPLMDGDMDIKNRGDAIAVWVNDAQRLMIIRKTHQ